MRKLLRLRPARDRWAATTCPFSLGLVAGVVMLMTDVVALPDASAADNRDRFEARVFRSADGGQLPYRLLKPKTVDAAAKYPLVLFLHGAGERGNDNRAPLVHGMNDFASDAIRHQYPCFVVAPQCPADDQWVAVPWSADAHVMPAEPAPAMRRALELLTVLEQEFPIDARRLYVTGLSMGGFGAWDAIQRYPDRFAAAAPVCGGGDTACAERIVQVPVWVFHGAQDGAVKPSRSRDMVAALRAAGGAPKYTEYPDAGHDSWTATYRNPEFYAWLFAQQTPLRRP